MSPKRVNLSLSSKFADIALRLLLLLVLITNTGYVIADDAVRIGVLSHRGDQATLRMWSATADYLSNSLHGYQFEIQPLDFDEVNPAVESGSVDFILVNPGIYVNLEVRYRVSRIATLSNRRAGTPYNIFGGVIFTRSDRHDINNLHDLRGRTFMAVDKTSLGGYQMAWRELKKREIDPASDFKWLGFGGTHDQVVMAVRKGAVDAATVRTDILERMTNDGVIKSDEFKILNSQQHPEFPFVHSTSLYPEWPFSKVAHTGRALAQQVAVALLSMPTDHPAALAGKYANWTTPLDYQPVHELFQDLRLPPYDHLGQISLADVIRQYGRMIMAGFVALFMMIFLTLWVWRLNRELHHAKDRLEHEHHLILDSVADGIYGVDKTGRATFVNRAMEQITGWKAEEMIGRNQHELLHHTHHDGTMHSPGECPVYATARDSVSRFIEYDVFWSPEGEEIPVEYSVTPIKDSKGETVGAVVVFHDITMRMEAEDKQRRHLAELAHVARLSTMGEMASGIAHEVNQPLAAITNYTRGCIRLLKSGNSNENELMDIMERTATQAERAGEIIRQLRQFIRKDETDRKSVSLNDLVRGVVVLVEPEARKEGVVIREELCEPSLIINVSPIQIEQVILNLTRNATESMGDTDRLARYLILRTYQEVDGQAAFSVTDTGHGIDEDLMDKIFEPFVTTKEKGMGLGLSISRGIIENHGGFLTAHLNHQGGTTFHFTLPVEEGQTAFSPSQTKK